GPAKAGENPDGEPDGHADQHESERGPREHLGQPDQAGVNEVGYRRDSWSLAAIVAFTLAPPSRPRRTARCARAARVGSVDSQGMLGYRAKTRQLEPCPR